MMQKIIFLFVAIVSISGFKNSIYAQTYFDGNVSFELIAPYSIQKTVDLNFGKIAVNTNAGTVVLTPSGTRSTTGGVTLPAVTGTFTAASFYIQGTASKSYSITLPTTYTISSGVNNMTINAFSSIPSGAGILSINGDQTLNVGATLNVNANQAVGTYTNAIGYSVTVNFP